ncbi:MAG: PqqD family protein [Bacteroidetes bacterium HGW-Bacteroidetes-21]|jgi:DNA-directed RNA polymerase delta subunit|nr:MAG: PqqD family protein [Bacteroidetes bacterium HGW-Bacteroidetes-21]
MKSDYLNNDVIQRNPKLLSSQIDGETIMMNMHDGNYYGLNEIASRIWEVIEKPVEFNQLVETLLSEFDVEQETCTKDVSLFLKQLEQKKLIIVTNQNG